MLWFLSRDKIIVKVSLHAANEESCFTFLYLFFLLPPFFSGFMSREVWQSETGWLLASVISVLSRHVCTGISNACVALNACIRLQLEGPETKI